MNITKEKRSKIVALRKKGFTIRDIAVKMYPRAVLGERQSIKPIAKVCIGIYFTPIWARVFR